MNLIQVSRCSNINCRSQQQHQQNIDKTSMFTRTVYQVDSTILCRLIKHIEAKRLSKSFAQLLYLASVSQNQSNATTICSMAGCGQQQRNVLLLTNIPDLISIAIDWNSSCCTTSEVEDLVSSIDPLIYLHELFYDVTMSDARIKQLNLIGLICFYGGTIEVFFSYDHSTLKWLFCFDGNIVVLNDWNSVRRKCIDFHLQPFLFIYANPERNPVDISQLLKRTVIQSKTTKLIPDEKRLEEIISPNNIKNHMTTKTQDDSKQQTYSVENLQNISSFATLNSSMLFMPKSLVSSSYINQETVAKVMQQQLLKKETLSDTASVSSSSTSSPIINIRHRTCQNVPSNQQPQLSREDASSSGDSSASSQRDSGLSSGINDGSSDGSPRDSLTDNEQVVIDSLIKQTENLMTDRHHHLDTSYANIEHYFEESLKHESASNYSLALESCRQALLLVEQILSLSDSHNNGISIYARTKKNSLQLRIRSLQKRQVEEQENVTRFQSNINSFTSTFKPPEKSLKKNENIYDNNLSKVTSILTSTSKVTRPKKNVKFSDNVALIVPTCDDTEEPPSEHLIHSFLRKIHQQTDTTTASTATSDSDSDTQLSPNDMPIGLSECTLCHKRCSKNNQIGAYCSNCHFYMQRFQPMAS